MVDSNDASLNIPDRSDEELTGFAFSASVLGLQGEARDALVLEQFLAGNVPTFMRALCPISWTSGTLSGERKTTTIWVMPDYLCIGSDEDYVRFPMNPLTAQMIADAYGAFLPTRRLVNTIFEHADIPLVAKTMLAGSRMRSTAYVIEHNKLIQGQLAGETPGVLVAGHKKDIVLCKSLFLDPATHQPWTSEHSPRVAIYGWARTVAGPKWEAWQGLNSTSHDNLYEDYSHGVRLIAAKVLIDGEEHTFDEVLQDPQLAGTLSDEGPLPSARYPGV